MPPRELQWAESFRRHLRALQDRDDCRDGGVIARRLLDRAERNARVHLERGTYRLGGEDPSDTPTSVLLLYPYARLRFDDRPEVWVEVGTPRRRSEPFEHKVFGPVRRWPERSPGRKRLFSEWVKSAARRQLGVTTVVGAPLYDRSDYRRVLLEAGRIILERVPRHGVVSGYRPFFRSAAESEIRVLLADLGEFFVSVLGVPQEIMLTERYSFALILREAFALDVTYRSDSIGLQPVLDPIDLPAAVASRRRIESALDRFFSMLLLSGGPDRSPVSVRRSRRPGPRRQRSFWEDDAVSLLSRH